MEQRDHKAACNADGLGFSLQCLASEEERGEGTLDANQCRICLVAVSDRGRLSCCDHMFCFACVDTGTRMTNVCPVCKQCFSYITRLLHQLVRRPGNFGSDGRADSKSREVEELWVPFDLATDARDQKAVSDADGLGFAPCHYVNEDAVECLDGKGCLFRDGLTMEDGREMAVACDACDRWFHTRCVNFRANDMSQESWHCIRCADAYSLTSPGAMVVTQVEAPIISADGRGTGAMEGSQLRIRTLEGRVEGTVGHVKGGGTDDCSLWRTRDWIVGSKWASEEGTSPDPKDSKTRESNDNHSMHDTVLTDLVLATDSVRAKAECRQGSAVEHGGGGGGIAGENGREVMRSADHIETGGGTRMLAGSRKGLMPILAPDGIVDGKEDEKGNWGLAIGMAETGSSTSVDPISKQQLGRTTGPKTNAAGQGPGPEGLSSSSEAGHEPEAVNLLGMDLLADAKMSGKVCPDGKDQDDRIVGDKRQMTEECEASAEMKRRRVGAVFAADAPDRLGLLPRGPTSTSGESKSVPGGSASGASSISQPGEESSKDGSSSGKSLSPRDDSGAKKDLSLVTSVQPSKVGASGPCEENRSAATTMLSTSNILKSEEKSMEEKFKEVKEKVIAKCRSLKRTLSMRERGIKSAPTMQNSESVSRGWSRGLTQSVPQQPTAMCVEAEIVPDRTGATAKGSSAELASSVVCPTAKPEKLDVHDAGRQKASPNEEDNTPSLASPREVERLGGGAPTKLKGIQDAGMTSGGPLRDSSNGQNLVVSSGLVPMKADGPRDVPKTASCLPSKPEECEHGKPSSSLPSKPDESKAAGKASGLLLSRADEPRIADTASQITTPRPEESQDAGRSATCLSLRPEESRAANKPSSSLPARVDDSREAGVVDLSQMSLENQNVKDPMSIPARIESQGAGKGTSVQLTNTPSRADSVEVEGAAGPQASSESQGQSKPATMGVKTSSLLQAEADIDDLPLVVLQKPARRAKTLKERADGEGMVDAKQTKKEQGAPVKSGPPAVSGSVPSGERAPVHGRGSRDSLLKKLQKGGKKGLDPELAMRLSVKNAAKKVGAPTQGLTPGSSVKAAASNPPATGKGSVAATISGGVGGQKGNSLRDRICPGDISLMARRDDDEKPAKRICRSDGGVSTATGSGGATAGSSGHREGGSAKGTNRDVEDGEGCIRRVGAVGKKSTKPPEKSSGRPSLAVAEKESAGSVNVEQAVPSRPAAVAGTDTTGMAPSGRSVNAKSAQAVKKIANDTAGAAGGVTVTDSGKKTDTAQWAAKILAKKGDAAGGVKGFVNGVLKRRVDEGKSAASASATAAERAGQKETVKGGFISNDGFNKRAPVGGSVGASKTNFELLAQMPKELRPQLENNLRSKVPSSIRQYQLDRILEQHLRVVVGEGASVRRTSFADLDDAVRAAVEMERTAFQRASGKIVYLNCIKKELANLMNAANELAVQEKMPSQDDEMRQRKEEPPPVETETSERGEAGANEATDEPLRQADDMPIKVEEGDEAGEKRESKEEGGAAGQKITSLLEAVFGPDDESDDDEVICMGPSKTSKKIDADGNNLTPAAGTAVKVDAVVPSEEGGSVKGARMKMGGPFRGGGGGGEGAGIETSAATAATAGAGGGAGAALTAGGGMSATGEAISGSSKVGDRGGRENRPTHGGDLAGKVDCKDPSGEGEIAKAKQQEQQSRSRRLVSVSSDNNEGAEREEGAAAEANPVGSSRGNSGTLPGTEEIDGGDAGSDRASNKAVTEENPDQQQVPSNEQQAGSKVRAKGGGKRAQLTKDRTALPAKTGDKGKATGTARKVEKMGPKEANRTEVGRESQVGDSSDIKGGNAGMAVKNEVEVAVAESEGGKEEKVECTDVNTFPHSDPMEIDAGEEGEEGLDSTSLMASDDCKSAVKQGDSQEGGREKDSEEDPDGGTSSRQPMVQDQVTSFVSMHLKPLLESGVISRAEFAWATVKTTAKVMQHHEGAIKANFLIREGARVRKLSEQYLETYRKKSSRARSKSKAG